MRQTRPTLLVLVVVVVALPLAATATATSGSAGATDAAGASADATMVHREVPNATNYLDIEEENVQRGDHAGASLDAGAAVEMAAVRVRARYNERAFEVAYADANNETERIRRLRAAVSRLDARAGELDRRQARATERYNAGELTAGAFLVELVAVDTAAEAVSAQFAHLRRNAGVTLPEQLDRRMTELDADLVALHGPARDRAAAAMTGGRPATTTYAVTSADAVVLSATDGSRFVREASVPANRAPADPNQFVTDSDPSGITAANERALDLYPWAYADAGPSLQRLGSTAVYRVTLDHSQGVLETYLDGATRSVFREFQTLRVDRLPVQSRATNTTDDLDLVVNRTYGTGPMSVRVVDPTTGDPVDATVRVNGYRVGATGDDGTLWTVTPHRQVRVEATTAEHTISVTFFA